jgi:hypothetical protein
VRYRILQIGWFGGLANFAAFIVGSLYLGGDALSGKAVAGHYFLSSHGYLTEISRATFTYSEWHARSVFITHPLAMLCCWLLSRDAKLSRSPKST